MPLPKALCMGRVWATLGVPGKSGDYFIKNRRAMNSTTTNGPCRRMAENLGGIAR